MKKTKLIELFGSGVAMARAMGVSRQYVSQLPEDLVQPKQRARVVGAAVLAGIDVKAHQDVFGDIPDQAA